MKTFSKIAVGTVAAVGLGFAAVAFSQGPGMGGGYGPGMHGYGAGMHGYGPGIGMHGPNGFGGYGAASMDAQLTSLKSELKLTENQTKAWEAFEAVVRNQAKTMADVHASMYASMQAGQPNPDAHIAIMEQRLASMKTVQKARADLYDALTPEQKAAVDSAGPCGYRG